MSSPPRNSSETNSVNCLRRFRVQGEGRLDFFVLLSSASIGYPVSRSCDFGLGRRCGFWRFWGSPTVYVDIDIPGVYKEVANHFSLENILGGQFSSWPLYKSRSKPHCRLLVAIQRPHFTGRCATMGFSIFTNRQKPEGRLWPAFLVGVFVSIGGMLFGYDTGSISGMIAMDYWVTQMATHQDARGDPVVTTAQVSLVVSIVSVGTFCGKSDR